MNKEVLCAQSAKGNVAELREALDKLLKWVDIHTAIYSLRVTPIKDDPDTVLKEKEDAVAMARAALSAPLRNCDVGSVEEQYDRCAEYCKAHNHDCKTCPLGAKKYQYGATCELYWAQMPYEKKEGEK